MPKFGSTKLVFNVVNVNDRYIIDIDQFEIDFSGFKIKSVEKIYKNIIDLNSPTVDGDIYVMIEKIKELLKERNITKSLNVLNYTSNHLFYEEIILPKLSGSESNKAFNLEMTKLYGDYNRKYLNYVIKSTNTSQTTRYNVLMIETTKYAKAVEWFKVLKINLNYVSIMASSIKRMILKHNIINKRRTAIFINIREFDSEILSYDGKRFEGDIVTSNGISSLVKKLAERLTMSEEAVEEKLRNGDTFSDVIENNEMKRLVEQALRPTLTEIKRMIGEFFLNSPYDNIYLNTEYLSNQIINNALKSLLKVEFSKVKLLKESMHKHFSSYGAIIRLNPSSDFKLPGKVRSNK